MTLYLKAAVGKTGYLLAAAQVLEIGPNDASDAERGGRAAIPAIDCRALFEEPADTPGYRIVFAQETGAPGVLIVDRPDGLAELGDDALRPLPAIGRFGALIDAVSVPRAGEAPAFRLRLGSALLAGAAAPGTVS